MLPKPDEVAKIREKTEQIEKLVGDLKAKHADPVLLNDVEVYAKAGRFPMEYPELFGTQAAIDHSFEVLDHGVERAHQLADGKPGWEQGNKRIEAYRSEIGGALQPYGLTFPANYDPRSRRGFMYGCMAGRTTRPNPSSFRVSCGRIRQGMRRSQMWVRFRSIALDASTPRAATGPVRSSRWKRLPRWSGVTRSTTSA